MKGNSPNPKGLGPQFLTQGYGHQLVIGWIVLFSLLTSCSWLPLGSRSVIDGAAQKSDPTSNTVPKAQYDQLLKKYQLLLSQPPGSVTTNSSGSSGVVVAKKVIVDKDIFDNQDPSKIIENISKVTGIKKQKQLVETVDIFDIPKGAVAFKKDQRSSEALASRVKIKLGAKEQRQLADTVEKEIAQLRKGINFLKLNRHNDAQKIFKYLQNSSVDQIRVRAKYYTGEILFAQGEYDLSMQVFDDIIKQHAFSGYALKSLGRLITCSEKMKLAAKRAQYHSLLYDFFGSKQTGQEG
ncbi:MAG: tetratricopeptide repeat protein [Bdellovibrionales bacterium]|nr:tetratricopeptide repeat protein [Bdellovibrionales bacterium]